ncbi:MAG: hypothetical protein HC867_08895 [Bacteroidia bacterium]|nr:hypothetical protein [Bacteroidia bacterium]
MRIKGARVIIFAVLVLQWYVPVSAQNSCIPTGINNNITNFPCGITCDTLTFRIPHLKSTGDYVVSGTPYNPFPFVNPTATEVTSIYIDDKFSEVIGMPFPFCFYDSVYNSIIFGSNSLLTFDVSTANQNNAYTLTVGSSPQTIPYAGGTLGGIGSTYYPPASIMAAYQDIDPSINPQGLRRIEYSVSGTAPCRKFIINYSNIPLFGGSCNSLINTHQIILNESTGIIDIYFQNKFFCSTWPAGTGAGVAILGVQNWQRNKAAAAPGKNATQWTSQNEGYRFTPNGGASRFVSAQILRMNGTVIKNADTSTVVAGMLDLSFPDICPTGNSEQFIIRTTFAACGTGPSLVSDDTITVNRTNSLNATETHTNVSCGNSDGTITVNVPAGVGTAPYQYSLNGGPFQSSNIFTGLAAGNYNVLVQDPNGCNSALTVPIAITGSINVGTPVVTNPSCSGVANGSITVNPLNGAAPYQYNLNNGPGGPWQTSNVFTNLAPGTYFLFVRDATGCTANNVIITVAPGQPLAATATTTSTSCSGANNGTITVNVSNGNAPYQFTLNAGPHNPVMYLQVLLPELILSMYET